MPKLGHPLNTSQTSHGEDDDSRSPRTPTYVPSQTPFTTIPPFDPSRALTPLSPTNSVEQTPPPPEPLTWLWQCHLCRSRYPLGATRRCLLDGHFYCSGETDRPNVKRKKKGHSCSSEFDYIGWKSMEQWKRKLRKSGRSLIAREPGSCENCEFPSQCRYMSYKLLGKQRGTSALTEIDLDIASTSLSESPLDTVSRFYKNETMTLGSVLAGSGGELGKSKESEVSNYYASDKKTQAQGDRMPTPVMLKEIITSVERRSGAQFVLSPIQEELLQGDGGLQDTKGTTEYLMPLLDP